MELLSLIVVGVLFGFFKPSKNNKGLSDIEKYKIYENTKKK